MSRMKRLFFYGMLVATAMVVPGVGQAQGLGQPVRPKMQSENLAPVRIVQPEERGIVEGITVSMSESIGFARDAALTDAARKGLPQALAQLETPVSEEEAESIAKNIGEPMRFVKSYKIVRELLVPTYTLTVDMVYDAATLQANFGKVKTTTTTVTTKTESTEAEAWSTGPAPALTGVPVQVTVEADSAADQDKVYNTLARAGLKPVWRLITREGGKLVLTNTGTLEELVSKVDGLGLEATVAGDGLIIRAR